MVGGRAAHLCRTHGARASAPPEHPQERWAGAQRAGGRAHVAGDDGAGAGGDVSFSFTFMCCSFMIILGVLGIMFRIKL